MSEDKTAGAGGGRSGCVVSAPAVPTASLNRRHLLGGAARLATLLGGSLSLAACAGGDIPFAETPAAAPEPPPTMAALGEGGTPVALLLPLSAQGNAGAVAQAMKNAAELAVAESGQAPIRLLVKDDGGTAQGARMGAEAALAEGARAVLGPLFAHSVAAAGQVTRAARVPMIAFSTDTNVATSGVYLLSFLPQSDVDRIVRYEVGAGRKALAALLPENAYGSVVEGAFQPVVADAGGRVVGIDRFNGDRNRMGEAVKRFAAVAPQADAVLIPDTPDMVLQVVQAMQAAGIDTKRLRLLGTGLWDEPRLFADPLMEGGQFAAPESTGWKSFSERYRARFGQEPVRMATLSYDAVSLVTAIVRTSGPEGLNDQVLTNPSGFSGVDGVFRFRMDGTNDRALAVMEIKGGAAQVASPAPRAFGNAQL